MLLWFQLCEVNTTKCNFLSIWLMHTCCDWSQGYIIALVTGSDIHDLDDHLALDTFLYLHLWLHFSLWSVIDSSAQEILCKLLITHINIC